MKYLLLLFILFSGCTKTKCTIQQTLENGLNTAIVTQLRCQNIEKVKSDVESVFSKLNLCPSEKQLQGTIADSICPVVSQLSVAYLGAQVPLEWKCDTTLAQAGISAVVTQLCKQIPY